MRKVLLFGADGFIGKNLVEYSKNNKSFSLIELTKEDCDLLKFEEIVSVLNLKQPDIIINAAYIGVNSNIEFHEEYLFNNLKITTNVLKACAGNRRLRKVIFLGSGLEYGDSDLPISEDTALRPQNIYAVVKAANSILADGLARHWEVPAILLKPFNLYGPYDRKSVIYSLINALKLGKKISLTPGDQIRDYLYIEDFCDLMIKILSSYEKFKNFETFNVGSGKPVKLKEVFTILFKIMKVKPKIVIIPYRSNDYMHQVADIKKIQNKISWNPKTEIEEGLSKAIEWIMYKDRNPIYNKKNLEI